MLERLQQHRHRADAGGRGAVEATAEPRFVGVPARGTPYRTGWKDGRRRQAQTGAGGTACPLHDARRLRRLRRPPDRLPLLPGGAGDAPAGAKTFDRQAYAVVREDHCLEPRRAMPHRTIDAAMCEQRRGALRQTARGWRLILKKEGSGPTIGKPNRRDLELLLGKRQRVDHSPVSSPAMRSAPCSTMPPGALREALERPRVSVRLALPRQECCSTRRRSRCAARRASNGNAYARGEQRAPLA